MSLWNKIKTFFCPEQPEPTLIEKFEQVVKEEREQVKKNPKPRKPRAKKVKNENT